MKDSDSAQPEDEGVDLVRRRLLQAGGRYVAPALLASLFLGEQALGQPAGCPPYFNNCQPFRQCQPGACPPIGGGS